MSHSKMLTTRRRKQKNKKQLARIAKRAKKLGNQDLKRAGADTSKEGRP